MLPARPFLGQSFYLEAPRATMQGVGTFRVAIQIGDPQGSRFEVVEALVDAGASYTWVPASVLQGLGVRPTLRFPFLLADGRRIEREMVETRVRLDGQERTTLVVFGDEGTQPLVGAYTLEGFGLAPDPVNRRLIPVPGLLMPVLRPCLGVWRMECQL